MGQVSSQNPVKGQDSWRRRRWSIKGGEGQEGKGFRKIERGTRERK